MVSGVNFLNKTFYFFLALSCKAELESFDKPYALLSLNYHIFRSLSFVMEPIPSGVSFLFWTIAKFCTDNQAAKEWKNLNFGQKRFEKVFNPHALKFVVNFWINEDIRSFCLFCIDIQSWFLSVYLNEKINEVRCVWMSVFKSQILFLND